MRFPYQAGLAHTLRSMYGIQRRQASARTLGLSSITNGEGYIGLRDADTSSDHTRFGDLPDGSSGLGWTIGNAIVNARTWTISQLSSLQSALSAMENLLTNVQGSVASQITNLQTRLNTAEGRLDAHATRLGALENALADVRAKNTQQDNRLDSHASRIGATENDITAIESDIRAIKKHIGMINP